MKNPLLALPVEAVKLPDIPDPQEGTAEHAAALVRQQSLSDITAMPWLPQGPDAWMDEIYERIAEAERAYAAPHLLDADYTAGTAQRPNDIAPVYGTGSYLFTAIHATRTMRAADQAAGILTPGFPDTGTAGLTAVLAADHGYGLIMTGSQDSNVATDPNHRFKPFVRDVLPAASGFLDVHGCASHLFVRPEDRFNVAAHIGLGADPTESMRELAQSVVKDARELGLYAVIGTDQKYYSQMSPTSLRREKDGSAYRGSLAGAKVNMLTNFAREGLRDLNRTISVMQIEIAGTYRVTPLDGMEKDRRTRVIGVALAHRWLEQVVKRTLETPPETV